MEARTKYILSKVCEAFFCMSVCSQAFELYEGCRASILQLINKWNAEMSLHYINMFVYMAK